MVKVYNIYCEPDYYIYGYRGYYMAARRYEISLRVLTAQRTGEIFFKILLHLWLVIYYIYGGYYIYG